jgi:hypothetical protein
MTCVSTSGLAEFVERFPRDRAKPLRPPEERRAPVSPPAPPTETHPPEAAAATPPEGASMEHRDQDQIEPSSCETTAPEPGRAHAATEEQQGEVTKDDQEVARRALAERMERKHPNRPAPRWFDARELVMVAACSAAVWGDADLKMQAQRDAIAGAFAASKDGPPTVRYIWGKLDHFFDHLDRGRRRRLADERQARFRAQREAAPAPRLARLPAPTLPREQMDADLKRIFGASWRTRTP